MHKHQWSCPKKTRKNLFSTFLRYI